MSSPDPRTPAPPPGAPAPTRYRLAAHSRRYGRDVPRPADAPPDPSDDSRRLLAEWDNPAVIGQRAAGMAGLDVLRAIGAGALPAPPLHHLLGIVDAVVDEGRVVLTLAPHESHYNPMGVVQGGVLTALLDAAMGCAVYTTLPTGVGYTTTDLQMRYVRGVTVASGMLRAEGLVVHAGARTATAEGPSPTRRAGSSRTARRGV